MSKKKLKTQLNNYSIESDETYIKNIRDDYYMDNHNFDNRNFINFVFTHKPNPTKNDIDTEIDFSDDNLSDESDDELNERSDKTKLQKKYEQHMNLIVDKIKLLRWGETILANPDFLARDKTNSHLRSTKMCAITKLRMYESYTFFGTGSKQILKYFMNKTKTDPNYNFKKIAQILGSEGQRRFVPIRQWEDLLDVYKDEPIKNRYLFEMIRSDQPCKPYLDIEWIETVKGRNPQKYGYTKFIKKLVQDIIDVFHDRYKINIDKSSVLISSSHSKKKASFHVVIDKMFGNKTMAFRTNRKGCPESAWDLYVALCEKDKFYEDVIDGSVYTTDREFRLLYSNKTTEFRPFIPYTGKQPILDDSTVVDMDNEEFLRYIITHSSHNEYYNIPTPEVPNIKQYDSDNFQSYTYCTHDDAKINHLLQLARSVHNTAVYTGRLSCGGWRFTYSDKNEPCYTGNYHESNGFCMFETNGRIHMKCMSGRCKGVKILQSPEQINHTPTKKLF